MSNTNDFLPFADDASANVETQAAYVADPNRILGNQPGVAISAFQNKATRQASVIASQIAQIVSDRLAQDVLDNGSPSTIYTQLNLAFPGSVIVAPQSATYAIPVGVNFVPLNASGGAFTATLPTAVGYAGKRVVLKRTDQTLANAITIATTSSQTIDLSSTKNLMTQNESYELESDGANWYVVDHHIPSGWVAYTLTIGATTTPPTQGAGATKTSFWRRVGDSIQIRFLYAQTAAGTAGSGAYLFPLPTGLTADTSKVTASTNVNGATGNCVGNGYLASTTTGANASDTGYVRLHNTTNLAFVDYDGANTSDPWGSTRQALSGNPVYASFDASVPITNW